MFVLSASWAVSRKFFPKLWVLGTDGKQDREANWNMVTDIIDEWNTGRLWVTGLQMIHGYKRKTWLLLVEVRFQHGFLQDELHQCMDDVSSGQNSPSVVTPFSLNVHCYTKKSYKNTSTLHSMMEFINFWKKVLLHNWSCMSLSFSRSVSVSLSLQVVYF